MSLPAASNDHRHDDHARPRNDDAAETEDVRGPCDEAEHRNDPRCTGTATTTAREDDDAAETEDRRGRDDGSNSGSSHGGDDRSGSNSGKG